MTIGVVLTDEKHQYIQTVYAKNMESALSLARRVAVYVCREDSLSIVYMRDCLGGLRAEARWNEETGTVTIKRT